MKSEYLLHIESLMDSTAKFSYMKFNLFQEQHNPFLVFEIRLWEDSRRLHIFI